jgi:hypothetical protein
VTTESTQPTDHAAVQPDPLARLIDQVVVLDTASPIVYLGKLIELTPHTFVLEQADMHDCRDGHVQKEHYLAEARRDGLTVNRRTVIVMRSAIISVSRLADIVVD